MSQSGRKTTCLRGVEHRPESSTGGRRQFVKSKSTDHPEAYAQLYLDDGISDSVPDWVSQSV